MDFKKYIGITEGFPTEGISFKDMSPLLADKEAFLEATNEIAAVVKKWEPTIIIGPESRGFVVGAPVAYAVGAGFVMARKKGKLPGEVVSKTYTLEYNSTVIELPKFSIKPGDRVAIVDDLLATGGTIHAVKELVEEMGGKVVGVATLIELTEFEAADTFGVPFVSLNKYVH